MNNRKIYILRKKDLKKLGIKTVIEFEKPIMLINNKAVKLELIKFDNINEVLNVDWIADICNKMGYMIIHKLQVKKYNKTQNIIGDQKTLFVNNINKADTLWLRYYHL